MQTGVIIVVFGVAILFIIGVPIGLGIWWIAHTVSTRPRLRPRGFEVKLTTGEAPVPREKENDHG